MKDQAPRKSGLLLLPTAFIRLDRRPGQLLTSLSGNCVFRPDKDGFTAPDPAPNESGRIPAGLLIQPDFGLDAHAGTEDVVLILPLFYSNPDWQALDNLDIVAGRVLGRQEAETGAAGPGQT